MFSNVRAMALAAASGLYLIAALAGVAQDNVVTAKDKVLFNFPDEASTKDWVPVEFVAKAPTDWVPVKRGESKQDRPSPQIDVLRGPKGGNCLKLTFDGGNWPAVGTAKVLVKAAEWKQFGTLKADLTVDRPSTAYFCIRMEKDGSKPMELKSRRFFGLEKTMTLVKGRNDIALAVREMARYLTPERGEIAMFIIAMFQPEKGQTLQVSNVRLSPDKPMPERPFNRMNPYNSGSYSVSAAAEYQRTGKYTKFKVFGTKIEVDDIRDLGERMKDKWMKPETKSIEQVESEFKAEFDKVKKTHPKAVLALLREGDKGCDPANPHKIFTGWKVVYLSHHGWDGPNNNERENIGKVPRASVETVQAFYRGRSPLIQVDLTSIPMDATVLTVRLAVTRASKVPQRPNLWVAQPCNRDWDKKLINGYFYASGKRWRAVGGHYIGADDPDFLPIYFPLGPAGGGAVSVWNFTDLVKFWMESKHPNRGFCLSCEANTGYGGDNMLMYTGNAKDIKLRPALMVIYEPKH